MENKNLIVLGLVVVILILGIGLFVRPIITQTTASAEASAAVSISEIPREALTTQTTGIEDDSGTPDVST